MNWNKIILAALTLAVIIGCVSMAEAHGPHHQRTSILVYDYTYDYETDYWRQVNTYNDYVSCSNARHVVLNLRKAGFYVSVEGPRYCPSRIRYAVYHNVFWVNRLGFYDHWSTHHYNFHHHFTRVRFHYHKSHNRNHHFGVYHKKHYAHGHYKKTVVKKYKKWKKNSHNFVPTYGKKSVTYKKAAGSTNVGGKTNNKVKGQKSNKNYKGSGKKANNKTKNRNSNMNRSDRSKTKKATKSRTKKRQQKNNVRKTRPNRTQGSNATSRRPNSSRKSASMRRGTSQRNAKRSTRSSSRRSKAHRSNNRSSRRISRR